MDNFIKASSLSPAPYLDHILSISILNADFTKFIIDSCISYAGLIIPGCLTRSFENSHLQF
jgi:hypothetical protein